MSAKKAKESSASTLKPGDCVCLGLRRAARTVTRFYDEALRSCNLKATQFSLLAVLSRRGRTAFAELMERLATDQSTLTRNLKPLERRGLIKVMPGADRRTREIELTSSGRDLYERADLLWKQAQRRATSVIGADKWKRMQEELDRLITGLPA